MKIESFLDNSYNIYLNNSYIDSNNYEDVGEFIKELIIKLKDIYNIRLKGFYNIDVYVNDKIGMFIKINKKNKYDFYMDEIDLKISIHSNSKIYYKTLGFDNIYKYKKHIIKYQNNYFYIDLTDIDISNTNIIELVEFGKFILD